MAVLGVALRLALTEPPLVVTVRTGLVVDAGCDGVTAVNCVLEIGVMFVSGTPANVAVSGVLVVMLVGKPVPLIVTTCPPDAGPLAGTMAGATTGLAPVSPALIVGAAAAT